MHTNRLIDETSPYLLQHAHNPVNWFPWGQEALTKAKTENKPVLVSIGYAACHWCHVMERESFEDESTAAFMNEHFVNIKIDREERPDLDHIYMDAVQAMTGSGGWPLNVFLTPGGKPFYGGTYFPPRRAFNRPSWLETLQGVQQAFTERRNEIDTQADNLTGHLAQSNSFGFQQPNDTEEVFTQQKIDEALQNIIKAADKEWGGFGNAPKFPQTFTIQYLLRYHYVKTLKGEREEEALQQALLSIDKMIEGGIYDQLGGGFARYSTDAEWLAPHFEKMLYDNALLLMVISEAYQLTKKERYREVIDETITFIRRELMHPQGGFYSALDADSEGEEGKFYVWEQREVEETLGADAVVFNSYYDVTNQGNWEGKNILRVKKPFAAFAASQTIGPEVLKAKLEEGKQKLLDERGKRSRPLLDDKILLGWNALMNTACSKAYEATGNKEYKQLAIENMRFLLEKFKTDNSNEFYHTWKGQAKYPAFLDDYAYLIQALLQLYEITGDTAWLYRAKEITEYVIEHFSEGDTGFFYYTKEGQEDIIVRKKEVYDGATPSGNAVMAHNLFRLSVFFNINTWKERSYQMLVSLSNAITKYPTSFGIWNSLLLHVFAGVHELAVVGVNAEEVHAELIKEYIPHRILMMSQTADEAFPLLSGKPATGPASIYLCTDFSCLQPVITIQALILLINNRATYI
jgi:uncharacterized protein YyaL (SSP411 family)